jgi:hypothetical protein
MRTGESHLFEQSWSLPFIESNSGPREREKGILETWRFSYCADGAQ